MSFKAYTVAGAELSQLREFYTSALYAFAQTEEVLKYKSHCKWKRTSGTIDTDLIIFRPIRFNLKTSFRENTRRQLRELMFIRMVIRRREKFLKKN